MERKRSSAAVRVLSTAAVSVAPVGRPKDLYTLEVEKARFLTGLRQFHENRGTPIARGPRIRGRELDLYKLYNYVTELGGWEKVNVEEKWADVLKHMHIPSSCANADHGLKEIYIRHLHLYEKANFFHVDPDARDETTDLEDLPSARKKPSGPVVGVPLSYNYQQHVLSDAARDALGLRKNSEIGEYAHLERSLISGLPNEIDFAINVSMLMSDGKNVMRGTKCLRVVELMLSHVGIIKEGETSLAWLYEDGRKMNFLRFWNKSLDDRGVKELVCPESFLTERGSAVHSNLDAGDAGDVDDYWERNLACNLGTEDMEGQRVLQVAMIIRNLSFEEENVEPFASSLLLFRFLMLCVYNKYGCIRQMALDTLSNVALKMALEPIDCRMTQLVLRTVSRCLLSSDRFEAISATEAISRLCQMDINEDALCGQLDDAIYSQLVTFLAIYDIKLIVSALEALYQLSELGHVTCARIASVTGAVDILVDLLTIEAQAYGPGSLLGIKVVETTSLNPNSVDPTLAMRRPTDPSLFKRPDGLSIGPAFPQGSAVYPNHRQPLPALSPPYPAPFGAPYAAAVYPDPSPLPSVSPAMPARLMTSFPGRTPAPITSFSAACNPSSIAAACNWLHSQYESSSSSCASAGYITKMEVYSQYIAMARRHGLQTIINPGVFDDCIRVAFPNVIHQRMATAGGSSSEIAYTGLVQRATCLPFVVNIADSANQLRPPPATPTITTGFPNLATQVQNSMTAVPHPRAALAPNYPSIHHALLGTGLGSSGTISGESKVGMQMNCPDLRLMLSDSSNFVKNLLVNKTAPQMVRFQVPTSHDNVTKQSSGLTSTCSDTQVGSESQLADTGIPVSSRDIVAENYVISGHQQESLTSSSNVGNMYMSQPVPEVCNPGAHNELNINELPVPLRSSLTESQSVVDSFGSVANVSVVNTADSRLLSSTLESAVGNDLVGSACANGITRTVGSMNSGNIEPSNCTSEGSSDKTLPLSNGISSKLSPQNHLSASTTASMNRDQDSDACRGPEHSSSPTNVPELPDATIVNGICSPAPGSDISAEDRDGFSDQLRADPKSLDSLLREELTEDEENGRQKSSSYGLPNGLANHFVDGSGDWNRAGDGVTRGFAEDKAKKNARWRAPVDYKDEDSGIACDVTDQQKTAICHEAIDHEKPKENGEVQFNNNGYNKDQRTVGQDLFLNIINDKNEDSGSVCVRSNSSDDCVIPTNSLAGKPPASLSPRDTSVLAICSSVACSMGHTMIPSNDQLPILNSVTLNAPLSSSSTTMLQSQSFPTASVSSFNMHGIPLSACAQPAQIHIPAHIQARLSALPPQSLTRYPTSGVLSNPIIAPPVGIPVQSLSNLGQYQSGSILAQSVSVYSPVQFQSGNNCSLPLAGTSQTQFLSGTNPSQHQSTSGVISQFQLCTPGVQLAPFAFSSANGLSSTPDCQTLRYSSSQQYAQVPQQQQQRPVMLAAQIPGSIAQPQEVSNSAGTLTFPTTNDTSNLQQQQLQQPGNGWMPSTNAVQPTLAAAPSQLMLPMVSGSQPVAGYRLVSSGQVSLCNQQQPQNRQQLLMQHRPLSQTTATQNVPGQVMSSQTFPGQIRFLPQQLISLPSASSGSLAGTPPNNQTFVVIHQRPPATLAAGEQPGRTGLIVTTSKPLQISTPSSCSASSPSPTTADGSASTGRKRKQPSRGLSASSKKKKASEEESNVIKSTDSAAASRTIADDSLVCEWAGCRREFESFKSISDHVTREHFHANKASSIICQWNGCDGVVRQRWSFMTHLQDRHLNENDLRLASARRKQTQSASLAADTESTPVSPPPRPLYPPNAALQAIRRFSGRPPFPEFIDGKEGPITKHTRLTSGLILRNLARYSSLGRSLMKKHEHHLAVLAFSDIESSSAISNCLWELQQH